MLLFTYISYVAGVTKMTLHPLTSWKQRLTSAQCQNAVWMAPDSVVHYRELLQNKSMNLTTDYIGEECKNVWYSYNSSPKQMININLVI